MRIFPAPRFGARIVEQCPVCSSGRIEYEFTVDDRHVARCLDCTMLFLREPATEPAQDRLSAEYVQNQVGLLREAMPPGSDPLLVILPSGESATIAGCDVFDIGRFRATREDLREYVGILCVNVLDRIDDPGRFLDELRGVLRHGAPASFTQPSVDSVVARNGGAAWRGFRSGASAFYSVDTLQSLLVRHGFRHARTYFDGRLERVSLRARESLTLICRTETPIERHRLSVIVPVYNERGTFRAMMEQLVHKEIEGVDLEIVIVESNSTDGSREDVQAYASHPHVSIIFQDIPKGKGNAVRAGIESCTGDIILFQDADLEYEIEDYDDLIRPIKAFQRNFVIGSRHVKEQSAWKIRDFNGAPVLSQVFNLGHLAFLSLLNMLYDQRLVDPFSMFKVFRRDCLAGLIFECDRFDFDFEIVIKLLRKGYRPLEMPVNYHSRSIKEGKKVTMVRDPLTWLRALVRYRTSALYGQPRSR